MNFGDSFPDNGSVGHHLLMQRHLQILEFIYPIILDVCNGSINMFFFLSFFVRLILNYQRWAVTTIICVRTTLIIIPCYTWVKWSEKSLGSKLDHVVEAPNSVTKFKQVWQCSQLIGLCIV